MAYEERERARAKFGRDLGSAWNINSWPGSRKCTQTKRGRVGQAEHNNVRESNSESTRAVMWSKGIDKAKAKRCDWEAASTQLTVRSRTTTGGLRVAVAAAVCDVAVAALSLLPASVGLEFWIIVQFLVVCAGRATVAAIDKSNVRCFALARRHHFNSRALASVCVSVCVLRVCAPHFLLFFLFIIIVVATGCSFI